jgi:hypothetical protein
VRLERVGLEPERLGVGRDGLVEPIGRAEGVAEVVIGAGEGRKEPDCLAIARDRVVEPPQLGERSAEVVDRVDVERLKPDRLAAASA